MVNSNLLLIHSNFIDVYHFAKSIFRLVSRLQFKLTVAGAYSHSLNELDKIESNESCALAERKIQFFQRGSLQYYFNDYSTVAK